MGIAEYAGRTGIGDVNFGITMPIQERIKQAQEIFKKWRKHIIHLKCVGVILEE